MRVYKEKDLFIKNNKGNKNNKHYRNNSISSLKVKEDEEEEHLSAKALEYKKEYDIIGKRIELLRIQKSTLTSSK